MIRAIPALEGPPVRAGIVRRSQSRKQLRLLSTMPIGVLTLELHLPHAHSLKEKRMVVRSIKDRLRARFNVAVAELEHQDLWQRALLGVVSISNDRKSLETLFDAIERESENMLGGDLVGAQLEFF